jgi:hypothetical protein
VVMVMACMETTGGNPMEQHRKRSTPTPTNDDSNKYSKCQIAAQQPPLKTESPR